MQKNYIWNSAACSCKNDKYLKSITNDSVTTCNENIDTTKTVPGNFIEKKSGLRNKKFLHFTHLFINCHSIIDSC